MHAASYLKAEDISFSYPRTGTTVLEQLNLALNNAEITVLVGPNGSGKTTLTKLLMGILRPSAGRVLLDGQDLSKLTLGQVGRQIGYIYQNPTKLFFCTTAAGEIAFGLQNRGVTEQIVKAKVSELLQYFELEHCAATHPLCLSHGEQQRLALAVVLALEPNFLILDEPTTGLDIYRKRLFGDCLLRLRNAGTGIMMVSHDRTFVDSIADRVITLAAGRITADTGLGVPQHVII